MSMERSRHGNCNDAEEEEARWMGLQQRKNRYYRDAGTSPSPRPDRTTLVWSQTQPRQQLPQQQPRASKKMMEMKKVVDVVYYLSRNGLLEHPHFMEVPLSSPAVGLHLRDVIARLDSLRGCGLADMYCWSSKRNYKGGYVWQDLSEDDLIHPCNDGQEYVLKGSQLLQLPPSKSFHSDNATPSPSLTSKYSSNDSPGTPKTGRNRAVPHTYEARSTSEFVRNSTDASTQTDGDKGRTFPSSFAEELRKVEAQGGASASPPPGSSSSNEGMEDGMKKVGYGRDIRNQVSEGERPSGRMKAASSALMQLIMCVPKSAVDGGGVDTINNVHHV